MLLTVGCPLYMLYLLKEDDEFRIAVEEAAPAALAAVQGVVDVDEARRDVHYSGVDRSEAGACSLAPLRAGRGSTACGAKRRGNAADYGALHGQPHSDAACQHATERSSSKSGLGSECV